MKNMKKTLCACIVTVLAATAAYAAPAGKTLVAVFSKTGEQYGVGTITEGNTMIIARMIAERIGADLFEIRTQKSYPEAYTPTTEEAQKELRANARPALAEDRDISGYDTIFIGYPIWWGEPPMAVYTFIEAHDFTGKTVIPFATHEGSGMGRSESALKRMMRGATFLRPIAVRGNTAQNRRADAQKDVDAWLKNIGF